jgi:hypothetical protein
MYRIIAVACFLLVFLGDLVTELFDNDYEACE